MVGVLRKMPCLTPNVYDLIPIGKKLRRIEGSTASIYEDVDLCAYVCGLLLFLLANDIGMMFVYGTFILLF